MLVHQTPDGRSTHVKPFAHIFDCEDSFCWRGHFRLASIRRSHLLGRRGFFSWQPERQWLFLDFMSAVKESWLHRGIYAQTASSGCSRLGTNHGWVLGVTLLQREVLEAKAGGASTVKVEAVVCTTLTAHSEPYNGTVLHASRLKTKRECAVDSGRGSDVAARNHGSQRRHRMRHRIATGGAKVFGFCSGAPPFVPQRKTRSLWLPGQAVVVQC
jgi:hypothetical protein